MVSRMELPYKKDLCQLIDREYTKKLGHSKDGKLSTIQPLNDHDERHIREHEPNINEKRG